MLVISSHSLYICSDSVSHNASHLFTVTLSGSGGEQFRGFLVQARTMADGSPVGVFTDNGDDQRISFCTPQEVYLFT